MTPWPPPDLPVPYYTDDWCVLYHARAEDVLPLLAPASVQLIIVDPPYFKTKLDYNGERLAWDRQWKTREAYLSWLRGLAKAWQQVLAPNGSLYCFANPQMAAWVEVMLSEIFQVLQRITWRKPPFSSCAERVEKAALRTFFPITEAILFAEHLHAERLALHTRTAAEPGDQWPTFLFEPIRAYLDGERRRAGLRKSAINVACGFAADVDAMASRKYFSASQWCLPTHTHYRTMQALLNSQGWYPPAPFEQYHPYTSVFQPLQSMAQTYLRVEYADLHRIYEGLHHEYKALRRPFCVSVRDPYTDVWDFAPVRTTPDKHPCEKPQGLLRHMMHVSSRPGEVVLDCCAGSGSTLEVAKQLQRRSIGIESDARYCAMATARLRQEVLF